MDFRLTMFACLLIAAAATAYPAEALAQELRSKRDVMETMKNAWNEVVRTMSDAGDAIVHVFKPTEKSIIAKVGDEVSGAGDAIVHVFQPTEKSVFTKMSDGVLSLAS